MADDDNDIRWGLAKRFEFIEWRAYWVGRINRSDLEKQFQISTPQASADFSRYQSAAPGNIEYNATEKSYVVAEDFRPKFLKLSPERFLLQVHALHTEAIQKTDTWFDQIPPVDTTPIIVRGPEAYTLRAILRAIEMRGAIEIYYRSLTRVGNRHICPHALAHDGHRWHVRALSTEHAEYRDYVLGRILSVSAPSECKADPADDIEWDTIIPLKLVAHPQLDALQRATIEHDYRFKDGELVVPIRLALAFYFIKRNNLDLRDGQITPERAQLFLRNYEEVEAALTRAKEESKARIKAR